MLHTTGRPLCLLFDDSELQLYNIYIHIATYVSPTSYK